MVMNMGIYTFIFICYPYGQPNNRAPPPAPAEGDVGEVALLVPGHAREEDAAKDAWVIWWEGVAVGQSM